MGGMVEKFLLLLVPPIIRANGFFGTGNLNGGFVEGCSSILYVMRVVGGSKIGGSPYYGLGDTGVYVGSIVR